MRYLLILVQVLFCFSLHAQVEISSTGTGTAYNIIFPGVFTYSNGISVTFKAHAINTGPATINVNSQGAKTIFKQGNVPLAAGDIKAGQVLTLNYDGTNFQMTTPTGGNTFEDINVTNINATNAIVSGTGTIGYYFGYNRHYWHAYRHHLYLYQRKWY
jgi:hypothetical protein